MRNYSSARRQARSQDRRGRYSRNNVRYIVVHSTFSKPDLLFAAMDSLPYHYLVTPAGRTVNVQSISCKSGTIEIGIIGGMNRNGDVVDSRSPRQDEALFTLLVQLGEMYPNARFVGADQVYVYPYANPGFDLQKWLESYVPDVLGYAA